MLYIRFVCNHRSCSPLVLAYLLAAVHEQYLERSSLQQFLAAPLINKSDGASTTDLLIASYRPDLCEGGTNLAALAPRRAARAVRPPVHAVGDKNLSDGHGIQSVEPDTHEPLPSEKEGNIPILRTC